MRVQCQNCFKIQFVNKSDSWSFECCQCKKATLLNKGEMFEETEHSHYQSILDKRIDEAWERNR